MDMLSSSGVQMYFQQGTSQIIREPFAKLASTSHPEAASSGAGPARSRERSDSFESLLSLSVLASELLEETGDLESGSIASKRNKHYSQAFPTPPTHSSPNFAHLYATNHARTDSNATIYSSEASNSNSVLSYSTQSTSEYAGSTTFNQQQQHGGFGNGIGIRAGQQQDAGTDRAGPSWLEGTYEHDPIKKEQPRVHNSNHIEQNGNGNFLLEQPGGYLEAEAAQDNEEEEQRTDPTTPLAFTGYNFDFPSGDDEKIQLADQSDTSSKDVHIQAGREGIRTNGSIPPNMKISDWLKQQYDSGIRSPPRMVPVTTPTITPNTSPSHPTQQRPELQQERRISVISLSSKRKAIRISAEEQESLDQLPPSPSSPSSHRTPLFPTSPVRTTFITPDSPGQQHRARILSDIIARDFSSPCSSSTAATVDAETAPPFSSLLCEADNTGLRPPPPPPPLVSSSSSRSLWHPTEYVGPIRRPFSPSSSSAFPTMKRNKSTGSIFGGLVGAGGSGRGGLLDRRNSSASRNMLDCISGAGDVFSGNSPVVPDRGIRSDDIVIQQEQHIQEEGEEERDNVSAILLPSHKRTTSEPGLSRLSRGGSLRDRMRGRRGDSDSSQGVEREMEGSTLAPGMYLYEENDAVVNPTGGSSAMGAGSWRKVKGWGKNSMNDLMLPITPPASPKQNIQTTASTTTGKSIPKHTRSVSSLASSLLSRAASTSSPTRFHDKKENVNEQHIRSTSEPLSPAILSTSHTTPTRQLFQSTTEQYNTFPSPPASPITEANNAAMLERPISPAPIRRDLRERSLSASSSTGSFQARAGGLLRRNARTNGPSALDKEEGNRLADLASEQVARDAEYRAKLVSKFRPVTPVPLESVEEGRPGATDQ